MLSQLACGEVGRDTVWMSTVPGMRLAQQPVRLRLRLRLLAVGHGEEGRRSHGRLPRHAHRIPHRRCWWLLRRLLRRRLLRLRRLHDAIGVARLHHIARALLRHH